MVPQWRTKKKSSFVCNSSSGCSLRFLDFWCWYICPVFGSTTGHHGQMTAEGLMQLVSSAWKDFHGKHEIHKRTNSPRLFYWNKRRKKIQLYIYIHSIYYPPIFRAYNQLHQASPSHETSTEEKSLLSELHLGAVLRSIQTWHIWHSFVGLFQGGKLHSTGC